MSVLAPAPDAPMLRNLSEPATQPSLQRLSYMLRRPWLWPDGFTWNYFRHDHCAMGLAERLWLPNARVSPLGLNELVSWVCHVLKLPPGVAKRLFFDQRPAFRWSRPFARRRAIDVTPDMVADAIDAYLAR